MGIQKVNRGEPLPLSAAFYNRGFRLLSNFVKRKKAPTNINSVLNARELHEFLGSQIRFGNWIQERIVKFNFYEGSDYMVYYYDVHCNLLNDSRNKNVTTETQVYRMEYAITIDMAKELGMIENNRAGKIIRKYFIAIEKNSQESLVCQADKKGFCPMM